jgi:hypothetical protein
MRQILLFIFLLPLYFSLSAQTTVFFQGFENAALTCTENWGYTGGVRNNQTARTGTFSGMVGRSGGSSMMTFNDVNISGLTGLNLQIFHSVRGGAGPGMDTREGAVIQYRLNGGAWQILGQVGGFGDHSYPWTAVSGGAGTASAGCNVYTASNPINFAIPAGTNTIGIRIYSVRQGDCTNYNTAMNGGAASLYDRTDEGFHVDDVRITTTSTSIPGIWTGLVSTDWFNCNNWHNRIVPTATTPVTIDQTAVRNCVVGLAAGSTAVCQSLTMSSNNGTTNDLFVQNSSALNIGNDVIVSKTAGTGQVTIEMLGGSTLSCTNLTLTGSASGAENAELKIEDAASTVSVSGNFTSNAGGTLDMSTGGAATGTLVLRGNWIGNGLETDFKQAGSNVIFLGGSLQTINTNNYTEVYHNLTLNKNVNPLMLLDNIEIDATGVLNLTDDQLLLNSRTLTVQNPAVNAIQQTGIGSIVSETTNNLSRIRWNIGATGGAHVFPFARSLGADYIPFSFVVTAGNAGMVTLATYGTGPDNLPWPSGPVDVVNNLNSIIGLSPDNRDATVDRFWQIDVTGTPTATITFTYAPSELPAAPYNDPFSLVAQRYETSTDLWQIPVAGQLANMFSVTVSAVTTFSPWTLTNTTSLLPVELLSFEAKKEGTAVKLDWETASELNNDYFDVQRSADGFIFETIGVVEGAGTYDGQLSYEFYDKNPLSGVNYYRIKTVDFDKATDYSKIIALTFNRESDINVFPNPVRKGQLLNIVTEEPISAVKIYNSLGQMLIYENNVESQIRFPSDISAGIYTMMIELNGNTLYRKLVIE